MLAPSTSKCIESDVLTIMSRLRHDPVIDERLIFAAFQTQSPEGKDAIESCRPAYAPPGRHCRVTGRNRDNLSNPRTYKGNPYVPVNSPVMGDLFDMFDFDHKVESGSH